MERRISTYIFILFLLTLVAGCRSHKHLTDDKKEASAIVMPTATETVKPQLDTIRNAVYSRYSANFSCAVEGVSVNGQIRIIHDSCIWISVNKIIEVGRIMITPTRVSGYSKIAGKYYDGTYEEVRKRWGVDLDYATIEALLVGNCPPNCTRSKEPRRDGDEVTLWYSQKGHGQRNVTLCKEFASKLLTTIEISQSTLSGQVRCAYHERTAVNGQMLPSVVDASVTMRGNTKQTRLTLSRFSINQQQNTPFIIPSRLEKL